MNIIEKIKELNGARFGSFGEYLYKSNFKQDKLYSKHSERIDFIHNGVNIDVKATRRFDDLKAIPRNYSGKKVSGIVYPYIQFYPTRVLCTVEKKTLFYLEYGDVEKFFKQWESDRLKTGKNSQSTMKPENKAKLFEIKKTIEKFFNDLGLVASIISRTTQKDFGKESAGNLIRKSLDDKTVRILLLFNDSNIYEENIYQVIAFKESEAITFPMLTDQRLHMKKVDVEALDNRYKFRSLDDLLSATMQK